MKKQTKVEIEERLKILNREMIPLVKRMTNCVSFNPPPKKNSLKGIKMNSPKLYDILIKYLTLKSEEDFWEDQLRQVKKEESNK